MVRSINAPMTPKLWCFMSDLLTTYQLTTVSRLVGKLANPCVASVCVNLLTEVTSYHGKLILGCKSLILLLLFYLPNLPPKGGIGGW